jgi:hypothetical protein
MIRTIDHFYLNLSNTYMALMMVAPMGLIMLGIMWGMFGNKTLNVVLAVFFVPFSDWRTHSAETRPSYRSRDCRAVRTDYPMEGVWRGVLNRLGRRRHPVTGGTVRT